MLERHMLFDDGKNKMLTLSDEDLATPLKLKFKNGGIINPDGSVNWDCPCLGGLPNSECGQQFRAAITCLINNKENDDVMKCATEFENMAECWKAHPELLPSHSK
ncbi:Mitochondrial intermembrane space import and assembly protein 40-B [Thelohanellus kitauei]|uniref:Mitochondrial intermembrane space import and assembly protein 40-B n=1 Tax=Thelohanellus kitauei TaxID=669202 RepID=A0A0C2MP30_THEKT|nr:Mitochondrial intermembrane space import and assembly protein 40-B [Thelohanellus kitauei]